MKTLITAVMLSLIATAGFAIPAYYHPSIETANTIIPKGKLISTLPNVNGFIMTFKGKVYVCRHIGEAPYYSVGCRANAK